MHKPEIPYRRSLGDRRSRAQRVKGRDCRDRFSARTHPAKKTFGFRWCLSVVSYAWNGDRTGNGLGGMPPIAPWPFILPPFLDMRTYLSFLHLSALSPTLYPFGDPGTKHNKYCVEKDLLLQWLSYRYSFSVFDQVNKSPPG